MFVLLLAVIVFLLCWAFVSNGLYFSESMYPIFIVMTVIICLYVLYQLIRGKWKEVVFHQYLLTIPILYTFTLLFKPESVIGTINQIFFWLFCCGFFYLLLLFRNQRNGYKSLHWVPILFAYFLFISNYAVLDGIFHVNQFVMILNHRVSGLGERLGSFLQYPNAFAIGLSSIILYLLLYFSKDIDKKMRVIAACPLPGLFALFVMTESRGAWLIFTFTWILSFLFIKKAKILSYLVISISTMLLGAIAYFVMISDHTLWMSPLEWIALFITTFVIAFIASRPVQKQLPVYIKTWHLPVALLILAIMTILDLYFNGLFYRSLPAALQNRLRMGTGTLDERILYWKDALHHIGEFFGAGLGGSGWSYFMYRVQSAPYLTSELHNGYLNIFVETGVIGICFVLGLLAVILFKMGHAKSIYFVPTLALLLGGAVDFSFSFGITIMMTCLYVALYLYSEKRVTGKHHTDLLKHISTILLLFLLILSSVKITGLLNARQYAVLSMRDNNELQQKQLINEALKLNPWDSKIRLEAASFAAFSPNQKLNILKDGLKYEPHHARMLYEYADLLRESGDIKDSITYYKKSLDYDHYDTHKYERYMDVMYSEAKQSLKRGDNENAKYDINEVLKTYQTAKSQEKHMNKKIENQRGYHISKKMTDLYQKAMRI